jgi:hypothetical protein
MEMSNLYDYLLHYNHHDGLWSAIPRDKVNDYWNDRKTKGVLKSKDIKTLIELITRGKEFIKKIK